MLYAIGDIHGQNGLLCDLLNKIQPGQGDIVVCVGDYIDRGPDSAGVIETILELKALTECVFLRGNHEQMMLEARKRFDPNWEADVREDPDLLWFANGGHTTIASYRERYYGSGAWHQQIPAEHWEFYVETLMEWREGGYHFVHAGILPVGKIWDQPGLDPRLWIREPFHSCRDDFGAIVVYGHNPQADGKPLFMFNKIGIDTGAAFGGPLTALAIDGEQIEVIQVR